MITSLTAPLGEISAQPTECAVVYYRRRQPTRRRDASTRPASLALSECRRRCVERGYVLDTGGVFADDGDGWTLNRRGIKALLSYLIRRRPDVLVIRDWEQIGKRAVDRAELARKVEALGVRIEALYPAGDPSTTWSTDAAPSTEPRRVAG